MNTITNYFKLSVGASLVAVFAFAVLVSAPQAHAAVYPNILADQDLTTGSSGQGVVVLQGLLSEFGYLTIPNNVSFGYYGSLTKDAVARYQASLNVTPAVGYYGSVTKQAMRSDFAPRGWLGALGW
jgi:peptidoglycan hydrolase-like protein with peptidoglycan-binding domain